MVKVDQRPHPWDTGASLVESWRLPDYWAGDELRLIKRHLCFACAIQCFGGEIVIVLDKRQVMWLMVS